MKRPNYGIGWIICDCITALIVIADLWTGKLGLDQWVKIVLLSISGGMLVFAIMKRYVKKERERDRAPKTTE